jgi:ATP-dependent protease ClpP protease subunit
MVNGSFIDWLRSIFKFNLLFTKQIIMLTELEKQKLGKEIALIIVSIGGIITLSYAVYFIVDTLKKWY